MKFNPEKFIRISRQLHSEEGQESSRQELAEMLAVLVGEFEDNDVLLTEKIKNIITSFPVEERPSIILELQNITKEAGWRIAHDIVAGALDLDKEIERTIGKREQVRIYKHNVERPENIKHCSDFLNPEGMFVHYWVPLKYDIQRCVKTAVEVHARSGKEGPIKILDVGGGSGFLGKLLADEAKKQGIELEVTVIDPDTETVTQAKEIFSDTDNLKFKIGTSNQALEMFGPELTTEERDMFNELEKKLLETCEAAKEELLHIKALLVSLESESEKETESPDISSILSSAFGNRVRAILKKNNISLSRLPKIEQISR